MSDSDEYLTYKDMKARLLEARKFIDRHEEYIMEEAAERGETYRLDYWYHYTETYDLYFTLEEALERAKDDCVPVSLTGPNGEKYNPYDGTPIDESTESENLDIFTAEPRDAEYWAKRAEQFGRRP